MQATKWVCLFALVFAGISCNADRAKSEVLIKNDGGGDIPQYIAKYLYLQLSGERGRIFAGDAHALLMACYKNEDLPIEFRARCAEAALKFEKPALQAVDSNIREARHYVVACQSSQQHWTNGCDYTRPIPRPTTRTRRGTKS